MPHRPERPASAAAAAPTLAMRGTTAAHILRPTAQAALQSAGVYHPAGVVTPIVNSLASLSQKPWVSSVHRMAPSKSCDSADRSTGTRNDEETVATLATEKSMDEMEQREATASALLLVSAQAVRYDDNKSGESSSTSSAPETTSVPPKKRKKHLDFLRRNQMVGTKEKEPCHVSPVSHSSVGGRTISSEEVTPGRFATATQRSHSYDSKESPYQQNSTQALLASSKIHNTTEIAPLSQIVVPHFPSLLHQVLSDPVYGTVLQWLPDGEAWKVLRWDALRRQVLPRYFADLRDENGSGCGTIDAFLWNLTAWGFEEVKDGSDVGAYRHDFFIRGAQKLCIKMRFNAVPSDEERNANGPNAVSPPRVRHPLQVPSLRPISRSEAESDSSRTNPNKRARYDEHIEITKEGVKRKTSPGPWYRSIDPCTESAGWGAYYSDHLGMRQMVGQYPSSNYDPRFHMAAAPALRHPGAYGPPQVRSGRGSLRLATSNRTNSSSSPSTTPSVRSSFPVSNRGKGRKTPACRSSIPTGDAANAGELKSPVEAPVSLAEAHRVGKAVHGVAVAVSRKTKRKLPLARNAESAAIKAPQIKSEEV